MPYVQEVARQEETELSARNIVSLITEYRTEVNYFNDPIFNAMFVLNIGQTRDPKNRNQN